MNKASKKEVKEILSIIDTARNSSSHRLEFFQESVLILLITLVRAIVFGVED